MTSLSIDEVDTGSSVFADHSGAVVNVHLASASSVTVFADTLVTVAGSGAGSAVLAWSSGAWVCLSSTVYSSESRWTRAYETVRFVLARAAVDTRVVIACDPPGLAAGSFISSGTGAHIFPPFSNARPSVETRAHGARVQ